MTAQHYIRKLMRALLSKEAQLREYRKNMKNFNEIQISENFMGFSGLNWPFYLKNKLNRVYALFRWV